MAAPSGAYRIRFERSGFTRDHVAFRIRPIRADDGTRERAFIGALSPDARYARMMCAMREPLDALVDQWVHVDYVRTMALVALMGDGADERIIGIARYAVDEVGACEFAVAVLDEWQGRGVAGTLSKYLLVYARQQGMRRLYATMFATNRAMIALARELGMVPHLDPRDPTLVTASRTL